MIENDHNSPFLPDQEDSPPKTENELFQLMEDTAEDIYFAKISPDQLPHYIILLIWFLDTHVHNPMTFEKHLITIRERITHRLDHGRWY